MRIGPYTLENPFALAPMAGVTDLPFRQLCRRLGAGYVVTEMLASNPALRDTRKSRLRAAFDGEAWPVAVQIAGAEPAMMADAAQWNVKHGAQVIDINMGCPMKKVCNRMAGSALLSDEGLVREIVQATVQAVDVPVTLKIRTGPDPDNRNGVRIAQIAERSGIAALSVHGRTRADRFKGRAEYDTIRAIVGSTSLPVFANGDIQTPRQAREVLEYTGAAGVMVGRGAQGNPWIFRELVHYFATGRERAPPTTGEVLKVMNDHLRALHRFYGERQGVRVARKHLGWYLAERPGGQALRAKLVRADTAAEQLRLLNDGLAGTCGAPPRRRATGRTGVAAAA